MKKLAPFIGPGTLFVLMQAAAIIYVLASAGHTTLGVAVAVANAVMLFSTSYVLMAQGDGR